MYTTKKIKLEKTDQLDFLMHEAGEVYSECLVIYRRIKRKKGIDLSEIAMGRLISNSNLNPLTVEKIIKSFFSSIKAWETNRKNFPTANPPYKRKWTYPIYVPYKAMKLAYGNLIISCGEGNSPLEITWKHERPIFCTITSNGIKYTLNAIYATETLRCPNSDTAGVDLGEIHIAVADTGKNIHIVNGRKLRSLRRYQNKVIASFQSRMAKCKKGSRKWTRLNNAKQRILRKISNQINDILQKQTTKLVKALNEDGVKTVGIGDMRYIRRDANITNPKASQKVHQMSCGKARDMITYKARRLGMDVVLIDESYTSQSCPKCLKFTKCNGREYKCKSCGYTAHRDAVGAYNIRCKAKYQGFVPVVGEMTTPVGMRYYVHSRTSAEDNASCVKTPQSEFGEIVKKKKETFNTETSLNQDEGEQDDMFDNYDGDRWVHAEPDQSRQDDVCISADCIFFDTGYMSDDVRLNALVRKLVRDVNELQEFVGSLSSE